VLNIRTRLLSQCINVKDAYGLRILEIRPAITGRDFDLNYEFIEANYFIIIPNYSSIEIHFELPLFQLALSER
jgi:hypothetical protein